MRNALIGRPSRGLKRFTAALLLAAPASAQIHVDASAAAGGDGQTWQTAFRTIEDAFAVASPGNRIWVAAGVYTPTIERSPGDPRSVAFTPPPGVRMFGGFEGNETTLAGRAGLVRETVLSGELGAPGDPRDNARNVVVLEGNGARHTVDGFTIRGGYADGSGMARGGGAITIQLGIKTIRGCYFTENSGRVGGAILTGISVVTVDACTFDGNAAERLGGALYATADFSVTNCRFTRNIARQRGGAVYANQGLTDIEDVPRTRFQNCVFLDNLAMNGGAAFVGDPAGPVAAGEVAFSGCTFLGNGALLGGGAIGTSATPNGAFVDLHNSILWGNRSVGAVSLGGAAVHFRNIGWSVVEGGWPGPGIVDADPLFVDQGARLVELSPGSPAIDAGANDRVLRDLNDLDGDGDLFERTPIDLSGGARRLDDPLTPDTGAGPAPVVDMGAYEFD